MLWVQLSLFVYLGTKLVVAHKVYMSSLLFLLKVLNGCFPPLGQFLTWSFAKSEKRERSVKLKL